MTISNLTICRAAAFVMLAATLTATAAVPQPVSTSTRQVASPVQGKRPLKATPKNNKLKAATNNTIRIQHAATRAEVVGELHESFEDFQPTYSPDDYEHEYEMLQQMAAYTPAGWRKESRITTGASYDATIDTWVGYRDPGYYGNVDGRNTMIVNYSSDEKEEWLITPAVTVDAGTHLDFLWIGIPYYFYFIDYDADWNATKGDMIECLEVLVRDVNGGEWVKLWSTNDIFGSWSADELIEYTNDNMERIILPLASYAGKEVEVGFRYWGIDGGGILIDDVNVGMPKLSAAYAPPLEMQYWGLLKEVTPRGMTTDFLLLPHDADLLWENTSNVGDVDASFQWSYLDADTWDTATQNGGDLELNIPRRPNTAADANWYPAPSLTATAPGFSDGTFKHNVFAMQVGGRAEYSDDKGTAHFGLLPFSAAQEGLDLLVDADFVDYGETAVSVFGYSPRTKEWWTSRFLGGDDDPGIKCHSSEFLNFFFAPTTPAVLTGAWVHGRGVFTDEAELTLSLYASKLTEDGYDFDIFNPIATATCKGSDILQAEYGVQNHVMIPFAFAEPQIIDGTASPMYLVGVSGYADGKGVQWFAPYQSVQPDPFLYGHGYYRRTLDWYGDINEGIFSIGNLDNADGMPCFNSFAISLDMGYPYLLLPESIEMDGDYAALPLDSYYSADELTASAVPGFDIAVVDVEGTPTLTVTALPGTEPATFDVTLSGTALAKSVSVKYTGKSGIGNIESAGERTLTGVYDTAGRRLNLGAER